MSGDPLLVGVAAVLAAVASLVTAIGAFVRTMRRKNGGQTNDPS